MYRALRVLPVRSNLSDPLGSSAGVHCFSSGRPSPTCGAALLQLGPMLHRRLCRCYAPIYTAALLLSCIFQQCPAQSTQDDVSFWEGIDAVLQQDRKGSSPQSCRYKYYFMFKVGDENADHVPTPERVRSALAVDDASLKELFRTSTTGPGDVCDVRLLSSSTQNASMAVIQAQQSNGQEVRIADREGAARAPVWSIMTVKGTAGLQAIKLQDVSSNISGRLNGVHEFDDLAVTTKMSRGKMAGLTAQAVTLPARTHTFESYRKTDGMSSVLPLLFVDATFSGNPVASSRIVSLQSGKPLAASPACKITAVLRSPRGRADYTQLPTSEAQMFKLVRKGSGTTASAGLRISMSSTKFYSRLTGSGSMGGAAAIALFKSYLSTMGGVSPGSGGFRRELSSTSTGKTGLRAELAGGPGLLAPLKRAMESVMHNHTTPMVNGDLPFRHQQNKRRAQKTAKSASDLNAQNFAATDYTQDYVLLFQCGNSRTAPVNRLDFTLVPKIKRDTKAAAFLCEPGSGPGLKGIENYMPRLSSGPQTCPTTRAHPYTLSSADFDTLHPEEASWVSQRLQVVKPKMTAFLQANMPNKAYTEPTTPVVPVPKIAIGVSGGGKRALLNGAGVVSGMKQAGVVDLAVWMAGISGGSWLIAAMHAQGRDSTDLPDAAAYVRSMPDLRKPVFDETFDSNEVLTNPGNSVMTLPVAMFNPANPGTYTDHIGCQGELRLQSPHLPPARYGSESLLQYWSRAIAYQGLSGIGQESGLGITFSDLADRPLLAGHHAPLPIIVLQQNLGDGKDNDEYRLWDVTPFDTSMHNGDSVHVSYPTALLGTDTRDAAKRCVTNVDQLSYLYGISSFAFPLANEADSLLSLVCGEDGSVCQALSLRNPFHQHKDLKRTDPDVSDPEVALLVDGGLNSNLPLSPFTSPSRQADIVLVVDSSARTRDAVYSDPYTCSGDLTSCSTKNWYTPASPGSPVCCNACSFSAGYTCWGTNAVENNDLFGFQDMFPEATLPSQMPRSNVESVGLERKVTFFGCDEDGTTAVVYLPNRIVTTGKSGFPVDIGSFDINPDLGIQRPELRQGDVEDILKNGQKQVENSANFKTCFACLVAATQAGRETFWEDNPLCKPCHEQYCYRIPG